MPLSLTQWAQLYLFPLLVALALWGGLTLALVWLNRRGRTPGRWALLLLLPALALAHLQLWDVRHDPGIWGCYRAFIAGLAIWAWHELAFYSGILTGPWRAPCPPGLSDRQRFGYALGTHLYHEGAVLIEAGLLWWLHHDATNMIGPLTFALSWGLQHSAKLNVLLGVRSLEVSLFPDHLRYLASFWAQRAHTPFFFVSVLIASGIAVVLWLQATMLAPAGSAVGMTLLATLATLGVFEHWLLVLPTGTRSDAAMAPLPPVQPVRPIRPHPQPEPHRWKDR